MTDLLFRVLIPKSNLRIGGRKTWMMGSPETAPFFNVFFLSIRWSPTAFYHGGFFVTLPRSTSGFTSGFLETHRLGTGWQVNIESRVVPKKCVLKFKVWKLNKDPKYDGLQEGVSFQLPRFWVSFLGVLLIEWWSFPSSGSRFWWFSMVQPQETYCGLKSKVHRVLQN